MWANNLKTFSVFAVVILHVTSGFIGGVDLSDPSYGNREWWAGNIYNSLTRWCVPLFVMISGYFLLNKSEPLLIFLKKRLRKILIPLTFWSIFFTLWTLLRFTIKGQISESHMIIVNAWLSGKPYYHLWYLFMIPFLYIITPPLRVLNNKLAKSEYFLLISFSFFLAISNVLFSNALTYFGNPPRAELFTNNFLMYIGYFCLGGYISKYNSELKINIDILIIILILSWGCTIFGSYFFSYKYFHSYLSINTVSASISLFLIIKKLANKNLKLDNVAKFSFGIYLIHPVFLDIFSVLGKDWFLNQLDIYTYIPLVSFLIFTLSYFSVLILSKINHLNRCI
ncbi:acyltransferase [Vibrio splendidus]|uniref:acyltransferase n=1 Tax=Vibrio splendidus TaxID=29497 RepID=UPI0012FFEB21|nr:acyltransferase family protein [Vibrio splendidus]